MNIFVDKSIFFSLHSLPTASAMWLALGCFRSYLFFIEVVARSAAVWWLCVGLLAVLKHWLGYFRPLLEGEGYEGSVF